jgi:hypothetical protein
VPYAVIRSLKTVRNVSAAADDGKSGKSGFFWMKMEKFI